ncbi:crossover junction endonuclease EME1 isoform X2 [Coregonus clupeaformis]|uniref:crossover junction endonuclease EME1 isoform X2 n=1 Tax=Coregonus clupeaformis TaxID=59861 RepID=UPI001BDFB817|nr:crossover junction endonuclease EME1 isoform X2 [Coregonus clupeaformis]
MGSYSDSTSDLDEDLPVYDFLQPDRSLSQAFQSHTDQPDLVVPDSSHTDIPIGVADVMMISSDDEEAEVPYIPLALRLKQRQEGVEPASSTLSNGQDNHHSSPDPPGGLGRLAPNGHSESEPLFTSYKTLNGHRRMEKGGGPDWDDPEEAALPQLWPPPKPSSWAGNTTSPAKRKPSKRNAEENQGSREEALRRREARERQQGDKEARMLQQERQKAEKKALAEAVKALRPEECIKHIVVSVDPGLLQLEGGGTLLTSLQALGCSCAIEKQPLPRSVNWVRRTPSTQTGEVLCIPEAHTVMQVPVDDFINLIHSYTQRGGGADCSPSLTSWTLGLQASNPGRTPSLVVIDLEKYFRSQKSQSQKKFRDAVLGEEQAAGKGAVKKRRKKDGGDALPKVSRVEVEEAVVHLQLHTGVQVHFLSTWKEFSDHVAMATKAVADAPFKREREKTGFSFYLESEWAGGQKVDRAGKGLLQVWKRQIQQLNRVSPDMASAVLAAYPSPQLLNQAYSRCKSEREKLSLLSDLLIRRGEGVTSTTRRVGPELSKRLCLAMTSSDPQQTLDSTL